MRRATTARSLFSIVIPFLSTLSLRRATINSRANNVKRNISIHALLAESDRHPKMSDHPHNTFLSTLSLRRATHFVGLSALAPKHFYPRSPCGERLFNIGFLFRLLFISIHALLAESDAETVKTSNADIIFLSTLSLRRATSQAESRQTGRKFLSTLSLRRATILAHATSRASPFLSTLSLRRAT